MDGRGLCKRRLGVTNDFAKNWDTWIVSYLDHSHTNDVQFYTTEKLFEEPRAGGFSPARLRSWKLTFSHVCSCRTEAPSKCFRHVFTSWEAFSLSFLLLSIYLVYIIRKIIETLLVSLNTFFGDLKMIFRSSPCFAFLSLLQCHIFALFAFFCIFEGQ